MLNIAEMPWILGILGFLLALLATRVGVSIAGRLSGKRRKAVAAGHADAGQEHGLRSLEAELRVARKKTELAEQRAAAVQDELAELRSECDRLRTKLARREEELAEAEQTLKEEIAKTVSLRHSLSDKAEETIRAQVKARDIETQLSIRQAGVNLDDDALEQIAAEHEELTGRLLALQAKIAQHSEE
jgi:predicted  nucleic acid-binding Zn-ribbon protein